jgi:hypothetical protein
VTDLDQLLVDLGACEEARAAHGGQTLAHAWATCDRPDWMLWLAARCVPRQVLVRAACAVARRALVHVPDGEWRPLEAIDAAERWCDGNATIEEVRAAYAAAYAYAVADAAAYAAYAAAVAAAAYADGAAVAAVAAAAAAAADADDAAAAVSAADNARQRSRLDSCTLIREFIPCALLSERLKALRAQTEAA